MRLFTCGVSMAAMLALALTGCSSDSESDRSESPTPEPDPNPLALPCGPLDSGFDGDERCILPPDPEVGIQLHVGPTRYDDPAEIDKFILQPGEEKTECYHFTNPHDTTISFFRQVYRMRPGSHHLIMHMSLGGTPVPEGWGSCYGGGDSSYMPIGGTQNGVSEFPPNGDVAPEDEKLSRPLPAGTPMKFELHFVNVTDKPILREAWVNLERKDGTDNQILGGIFMTGGVNMNIAPGTKEVLKYSCTNDLPDRRVVSLFGHRHAHTTRFSVWQNRGTEREILLYEDYEWEDTAELVYNTLIKNPAPDPVGRTAGGYSGLLMFNPGDTIEFECEIDNTGANGVEPSKDPLTFANEVYTGEMCNLFGSMVNNSPADGGSPLSNFFWGNRSATLCSPRD
jgi:hypothetical protein